MKVSVILVTYNHGQYVAEALDSILGQQTQFPFELIITEDCSTDGTRDIVTAYANKNPDKIRVLFSESNINTNYVMSRAIAVARGEYVALIDGDDFWTCKKKLQRQVDFLDARSECSLC